MNNFFFGTRGLLLVLCACGASYTGGEMRCPAGAPEKTVVMATDLPRSDFQMVGNYLCYAPEGAIREDTCTQGSLYLQCAQDMFTYCPSPNSLIAAGVDATTSTVVLRCGTTGQH